MVFKAVSDYHLWFWHVLFGFAGSLNDLKILNLSLLLELLVDETFIDPEKSAYVVPFQVAGNLFERPLLWWMAFPRSILDLSREYINL